MTASRSPSVLRFLVPSGLGVLFLLTPVPYGGRVSIVLGHAVDAARTALSSVLAVAVVTVVVLSAAVALGSRLLRAPRNEISGSGAWRPIFRPSWPGVLLRVAGAAVCLLVLTRTGPEWLIGPATGQVILGDLMTVILVVFAAASFLLPCLTDYGLMELVGTMTSRLFRPLFGLPGRAAVDALASWLGAASVGVLITADQYERGFYTQREAAVIATNFSVVSVAFAYVIVDFVGLGQHFVPFYATIVVCGLVAALVTPFLPPLRSKPDVTIDGVARARAPRERPTPERGGAPTGEPSPWAAALERAARGPSFRGALTRSVRMLLDIWLGLLPAVAVIGTAAIVLAETTPLFRWLGLPFVPLLQLLGLPEATDAAPAMVVGFADQFLPAVVGRGVSAESTRFVIACACVNQLIYLSEVGVLMLRSSLPLSLLDLALVFLVRTLVTLPVAALAAHWIV